MKLKDFAQKYDAESSNLKFAIGGEAGSGKTFTAVQITIAYYKFMQLKKPLLYIDNEKGFKFVKRFFDEAKIEVFPKMTSSLKDIKDAMEIGRNGEIDFLFIDSMTKIYKNFVEAYQHQSNIKFMSMFHFMRIIPLWNKEFSDPYYQSDINICFTGRGGYTYSKEDDEKDDHGNIIEKGRSQQDGVKLKLPTESAYEPDLILWMTAHQQAKIGGLNLFHQLQVIKDRSSQLEGKVFDNPTGKELNPYFKFLKNLNTSTVISSKSETAELIPAKADREYWQRQEQKEILIEKIKALFEKFGISGTSKDAKQINALIAERIFGTTSWKEVEISSLEKLELFHNDLNIFFSQMDEFCLEDKNAMLEYIKSFQLKKVA